VVVVFLEEVKPDVEVPGRRKDCTVKGKRLVRRFFWNILRGTVGGLFTAFLLIQGGSLVNVFERSGKLTGPENAQRWDSRTRRERPTVRGWSTHRHASPWSTRVTPSTTRGQPARLIAINFGARKRLDAIRIAQEAGWL
jgi:hypothetical protein